MNHRSLPFLSSSKPRWFSYFRTFSAASIASGLLFVTVSLAVGQEARLVKDFNSVARGSNPQNLTEVGGRIYFSADDGIHGRELWMSDGTSEGTRLIHDIRPGAAGSNPGRVVGAHDLIYFGAEDGVSGVGLHGRGLWQSDGTPEGTAMAMASTGGLVSLGDFLLFGATDFAVRGLWRFDGSEDSPVLLRVPNGNPRAMTRHQDRLFYWEPGVNPPELWKSDGTVEGTAKVAAVPHAHTWELFSAGDLVFFKAAPQPNTLEELWVSDGTEAGTVKLAEFSLGGGNAGVSQFVDMSGILFFSLYDYDRTELWKSDGTEEGTVMIRNFNLGGWQWMSSLRAFGDELFFIPGGPEFWRSDGTDEGTFPLSEYEWWPSVFPVEVAPTDIDGTLFFTAGDDEAGLELWKSDGTEAGTGRVKDIREGPAGSEPKALTAMGGKVYFSADDGIHGRELWVSDGTEDGTRIVHNINSGTFGSSPQLFSVNEQLVVTVNDGVSPGWAWRTDGTEAGTVPLPLPARAARTIQAGDNLFFRVGTEDGTELWKSDGTVEGTNRVKLINPAQSSDLLQEWADLDGTLLFTADDGIHGVELWSSDGTESGTTMLRDLRPGSDGSSPQHFTVMDDQLLFLANVDRWQWWRTDGTEEGTAPIPTDHPGDLRFVGNVTPFGERLVFSADGGGGIGTEPWIIDESGVRLLKNIREGASSSPFRFRVVEDTLFFVARDGVHGQELWKTDGTTEGTVLVRDIRPGSNHSIPDPWVGLNGKLLFTAADGVHGREPWKSDGTWAGTTIIGDFTPGSAGSVFGGYALRGDLLYFGVNGELWVTDATSDGTRKIADGWVSPPRNLEFIDDVLFFVADGEDHGLELWASDGTRKGTVQATAIAGRGDALPQQLRKIGGDLYFSAYRPDVGRELFVLPLGTAPALSSSPENRFANSGEPLTLPVEITGDHLRYSWYRNDVLIEDTTGPSLTIEDLTHDASGTYRVIARNLAGIVEATVRVTVDPARPIVKAAEYREEGFRLRFSVMNGLPYRIVVSDDLLTWTTLIEDFSPSGETVETEMEFLDPSPENARRFYRIELLP